MRRLITGAALTALTAKALLRGGGIDLGGRVAVVTGGSRGLGLALAREFASQGAAVVVCARNAEQVEGAASELRAGGADALGVACDVRDPEQVRALIDRAVERHGRLDVLVNNAGTISIGPVEVQTLEDFQQAMDTMFWGTYHPTMAALPHLRAAEAGRIVNITSIGGKVPAPHLLPYTAAKSAAVGFSEGLRVELAPEGVLVTTVVPGLMRTGSHLAALAKGDSAAEFRWFGLAASLPVTSTSAEHAARRIVAAARRGDAEVILTWQAHLAVRLHGLAPALSSRAAALVDRLLPDPPSDGSGTEAELGGETGVDLGPLGALGDRAAETHRQSLD
ncbi:MAG: SDR family oxidoreductase, partial [Euzebyaceae bacterium]|jgi:NAD(P)-dependent dehydrogenase (short-subunit alcohol dehydrogenase family)|nr:SDR family oxidoreductase [Euzebyaceae bacterium]